ncbi:MAG TPA: oxidoreductase [Planctomycetaceae bacterium]|nr:oxidoreductase [Planctomycetaceae bacterium]HRF02011.1 Gfo/Idh/MocA family oxidoreductase [Pirellulaceae bacterium]
MDRRRFVTSLAAGLAAVPFGHYVLAGVRRAPRRVALIGCGWYGKADLLRLLQVEDVDVVSLCDVDSKLLDEAQGIVASRQKSGARPEGFVDYHQLLSKTSPELVLVDTPDHWHALPMIDAVKSGADVWVQKPIGVDVIEGQAMVAAARKFGRVVQVGTQRRSTPHLIDAKRRFVDSGRLGRVAHAEVYCYYHMRAKGNPPDIAPPESLDYERWVGPAAKRPFDAWIHPRGWRAYMEYGNGIVGDMCIHMLDMVRWMLDLGWPKRVDSVGGILVDTESKSNITDTQTATFDFDELSVVWQHRTWGAPVDPEYPWGATLYGEKGTLRLSVDRWDFRPQGPGEPEHGDVVMELDQYPVDRDEKDLERHVAPAIRGHMKDWLAAIDARSKPVADIEQGHISTTACLLANLSQQLGRSLAFDPATHTIPGDDQATALLRRPYHNGYRHPDPSDFA